MKTRIFHDIINLKRSLLFSGHEHCFICVLISYVDKVKRCSGVPFIFFFLWKMVRFNMIVIRYDYIKLL